MRTLWRFLLLLLVLLPLSLGVALFSERGSQALLGLADRYSPLEVDYASGTIAGRLKIHRLALGADSLWLEVRDLEAELAPACLWRSALCFSHLAGDSLVIDLSAGDVSESATQSEVQPETDGKLLVFPLQLETDVLALQSVRILWPDGEWRQGPAKVGLRIAESRIDITRALLLRPTLELREPEVVPPPPVERIDPGRIDLPFELSVQELILQQPAWSLYGSGHRLEQLKLRGHWRHTALQLERLEAVHSEWGTLSLAGDVGLEGNWPLRLDSQISLARPPLWEGLHRRELNLAAQGSLADLALQLGSQGAPEVSVQARLDVLDRLLPFEASGRLDWADGLLLGDIEAMPAALAQVTLDSPVSASLRGSVQAQQFAVNGTIQGAGYETLALAVVGSHAQGRISLHELTARDQAAANAFRGSGELLLEDPLRASLTLASDGFDLPRVGESADGRVQGSLQLAVTVQDEAWQVAASAVDLTGEINGLPARALGHVGLASGPSLAGPSLAGPSLAGPDLAGPDLAGPHLAGPRLAGSDLQAQFNGAQLTLRSRGDTTQEGQFELTVADLGRWQPGSRGQISLQGRIAADGGQLHLTGSLLDIHWQGLRIGRGNISGDYLGRGVGSFNLDTILQDVTQQQLSLGSLHLRAQGTPERHVLTLMSRGDLETDLNLEGRYLDGQWNGRLAATNLQTPQGTWRLSEAVAVAWSAGTGQFSMAAHCWRQEQTRICPGALQWAQEGSGSLEVKGDMGFLSALMPEDVEVQGDMQLQLEGVWTAAAGLSVQGESRTRSVLLTRHFGEGESARLGWDKGDTIIDYGNQGLRLDWEVQRNGQPVLGLNVLLPPEREAPLTGSARVDLLQLDDLAPFAPMLSGLEGKINGQLRLAGTVDRPLAHGVLELTDGRLALVGNPTQLEKLNLRLELQGNSARINGIGRLGGGELRLAGELNSEPEWRLALTATGDRHSILYPPATQLVVSESLDISAGAGLLDIRGEVTVHEGSLEPEDLPEGSVAVSADVVQVDYAGNVIQEELPFDVSMDVRVRVKDGFKVVGSLTNITLGGNLHLLQKPKQPLQLFGNLNVLGGELRAYQQRLLVDRGTISFSGRPDNPALDLRAQRDISGSNIVVGVKVHGTFDELLLEVFSDPVMSQGEAMSYLVRGRGLDSTADADGTALALSVASSAVNRSTLVAELNRIPGISDLTFGAEGSAEDTAATVSGYIGNRIYLSYGFGLYEPINVLTARLYLRTRLWLEVVSSLENSVDLYYSFDIN